MKTSINDFIFRLTGHGHYTVIYTSPVTGKQWKDTISDMTIIDATKNSDNPKKCDLDNLKRLVKRQ